MAAPSPCQEMRPADVVKGFLRQAEAAPERVALQAGRAVWSYRELDRRSGRVAGALQRTGVGRGHRVGLLLERSPEALVAVLGVLRAGAAYVPLDPAFPPARLGSMIRAAECRAVLRKDDLAAIDTAAGGPGVPIPPIEPSDPAYVLFTSGSTGEPKGIVLGHLPLANLIAWHLDGPRLSGARTLQLASLGFDASFHEAFATWCSGGCLVMASERERRDPAALVDLLQRERVEKAILPVVLLHELAEECLARDSLRLALREVTATGEQLHVTPAVVRLFERLPSLRLHNHYGPSETHVVTSFVLPDDPRRWPSHPPIGRPISGTSLYLQPGTSELLIGGVSLAQGYAGRPALTAERFVPDPYSEMPGGRLYRTGDRARRLDDGCLVFLGRLDDQLKVRGHRVEPAEVEAALDAHPAVRTSAVALQGDGRLTAFVSLSDASTDPSDLRDHLRGRLPAYMIPASFVAVDRFPRTRNGKLDRQALASLAGEELRARTTEPPHPGVESRLAEVWREVLGRQRLGRHDDFFALGGDSLLAMRTITRLRREFGGELSVRVLFEHPTIARLAPVLTSGEPEDAGLPETGRGEGPLSFGQERLWFLHQLRPRSAAYNLSYAWSLDGPLDVAAFQAALGEVLRRHAVLRSTIVASGPRQAVTRGVEPALVVDLRRLAGGEAEGRRKIAQEAVRPFDLERGPLLRPALFVLGRRRFLLALHLHHATTDGWSQELLYRELEEGYRGRSLPELPLQYADFAAWQRRRLESGAYAEAIEAWRRTLTDLPPLRLPTDRTPKELRGERGAALPVEVGSETAARLRRLAAEAGASLFMTLTAAFLALLGRTAGQDDFGVGSPVADRPLPETEKLVGFFVNTIVLRADLRGQPSFRELVGRVRRRTLDAFARREAPFERVVEALRPERETGRSPLFQVLFAFENASRGLVLPGIESRDLQIGQRVAAQFDLVLFLREAEGALAGALEHRVELFDASTVLRLRGHFLNLTADAAAHPERAVSELAWLSPAELHQVQVEWNDTSSLPAAQPLLFPDLFTAQAALTPDAIAVADPARGWATSYRELDLRSDALAAELRRRGVGEEVRVALLVERSLEQVMAVVAVLKSGGAYVPLEPSAPAAWWRRIVEDAGAELLVTQEHLRPVEPLTAKTLVLGSGSWPSGGAPPPIDPRAAAYVIYTSGSTGRPKGAVVSHGSLAWLLSSCAEGWLVGPGDRLLVLASIAFDLAVVEIQLPLVRGVTLVLGDTETIDASVLLERCREHSIDALFLSTALWHELVRQLAEHPESRPASLRLVTLGTERMLPPKLAVWRRTLGAAPRLVHLYGLTEATAESTWRDLTAGDPVAERGDGEVTIGRPVPGARLYVLDRRLRSVPAGTPGELCVAGPSLARGYHRQGRATAERFVPHPLAGEAGERLLLSGDLVRRRADGCLEVLGRRDLQVKVRGQRFEPGEVEAELAAHPAVADAAVALHRGSLTAWVAAGAATTGAELRRHLERRLPASRIPAAFVFLDALPRNRSGKVDRRRLPEPERPDGPSGALPRGPVQEKIAALWCELLGLAKVGAEESFFDLGGHSLLVVELRNRLQELFGEALPIAEIFRHSTVAQLAERLDRTERATASFAPDTRRRRARGAPRIAVVGLAGRFPGCPAGSAEPTIRRLWRNLRDGVSSVRTFSPAELEAAGVEPAVCRDPRYVPASAVLDDIEGFDAAFFDINLREADLMDPQHRALLECAWEALENAGMDPRRLPGPTGVFAGSGSNTYALSRLVEGTVGGLGAFLATVGNERDYLAARLSYKLDLKGPSLTVQTACSTSLVAVHLACQSLLAGECDLALAGGVAIAVPHRVGYLYEEGSILSPDGCCRPFDAGANGTVPGSGAGVVVLKRLDDALADGDRVEAVIAGSAVNNDGAAKLGFSAPSASGQEAVVGEALAVAGFPPATLGYVEGHGTGTPLGDPVEVDALTRAFRAGTSETGFCALGSVKGNLGHLDVAAGVVGLIKTVLALRHGEIPPSLHFSRPNPEIDFATSPFYVATELRPWPRLGAPRRGGVSSFGIGGTNAHVVLEEAPAPARPAEDPRPQCLVLSARTAPALEASASRLASYLAESRGHVELADVAYTLQAGRARFEHRLAVVAEGVDDAVAALREGRASEDEAGFKPLPGRRRLALPTYPFERRRHWIEPTLGRRAPEPAAPGATRDALPVVTGIWREVLGVEQVEAANDFFDLGGDSLSATQVLSRLRRVLGVELTVDDLFEAGTAAALACRVEERRREGSAASVLPTDVEEGLL